LARATFIPSRVLILIRSDSNSATIARTLNNSRPDRVARIVYRPTEVQLDLAGGELVDDVAGVGQRAGEPIELGDDEGVAGAARGEGLA
jgi:hypothetical protein